MNSTPKILLIQLFSNGDCLYATTVAKQIKHDYPECHLTWAIADYCKTIIDKNPFIDDRIIIKDINHANWKNHWKNFQSQWDQWIKEKKFDKIYFTQIIDSNFANYDYCLRSSIFKGYDRPITVDIQPILNLSNEEIELVDEFALRNKLTAYSHVILMEFAHRSGQANFSAEKALRIAQRLTLQQNVAVIFSSNTSIHANNHAIIDGSI